jgi:hypothetical protein
MTKLIIIFPKAPGFAFGRSIPIGCFVRKQRPEGFERKAFRK